MKILLKYGLLTYLGDGAFTTEQRKTIIKLTTKTMKELENIYKDDLVFYKQTVKRNVINTLKT